MVRLRHEYQAARTREEECARALAIYANDPSTSAAKKHVEAALSATAEEIRQIKVRLNDMTNELLNNDTSWLLPGAEALEQFRMLQRTELDRLWDYVDEVKQQAGQDVA